MTCRARQLVRLLPVRVVVCLFLAGCLFAELGSAPPWVLFDLLCGPAVISAGHIVCRWGLLVTAIDGTTMSVADAEAVRGRYREQCGNQGGAGYPALRLGVLLTCGTGAQFAYSSAVVDDSSYPHVSGEG